MKLKLFTSDDCSICADAELQFRKNLKKEIDTGEAQVVNLDHDDEAVEFWVNNDLPLAPVVVLTTDDGKRIVSNIDAKDFLGDLKPASPAAKGGDKSSQVEGAKQK